MANLTTATAALRAMAADLAAAAAAGTPPPPSSLDGGALLAALKAATTADVDALESARAAAASAASVADGVSAHVSALAYRAAHYSREVGAAAAFHSAYDDAAIDLMPVADFWATAPPDLVAAAQESAHGLERARLEHERAARVAAVDALRVARADLKAAQSEAAAARTALAELAGDAASVAAAVDAVRARLRLPHAPRPGAAAAAAADAAAGLPPPLYTVYSQLAGAAGGWPEVRAVVESVAGGDASGENAPAAGRVHVRLLADGAGEDEEATSPLADIELAYIPSLRVVTAGPRPGAPPALAAATATALATAFPDDDGTRLPTEAACRLAGGEGAWPAGTAGKPYRWAQALAGLDLHPADSGAPPPGVLATLQSQTRGYTALRALRDVVVGGGSQPGGDEEMEDGEA